MYGDVIQRWPECNSLGGEDCGLLGFRAQGLGLAPDEGLEYDI